MNKIDAIRICAECNTTGVFNSVSGEMLSPNELDIPASLWKELCVWVQNYWSAAPNENGEWGSPKARALIQKLDNKGIVLAQTMKNELGGEIKILYVSEAYGNEVELRP